MSSKTVRAVRKPTKKYDSDDSKKRLLKAALDIFSKRGYDAATTREIAKRAKVNDSLIQRYFGGKLGLLISLIHRFQTHMKGASSFASSSGDLKEEIEGFFHRKRDFSTKHRKFLKIVMARAMVDPKIRAEMSKFSKNGVLGLSSQLEELQRQGKIRADLDIAYVSRFLSIVPVTVSILSECVGSLDPAHAEQIFSVAANIISRGLKTKSS